MSTAKERAIAEILNGDTDLEHKCAVMLGYDAGYAQAIEDAAKAAESHMVEGFITYNNACRRAAKAIRALAGKAESSQK